MDILDSKKNIEIKNEKNLVMVDNLIIERVNKHLKFNSDIVNQMKQIEFICMYKRPNMNATNKNKYNLNIFTFTFYVSNEIANSNVPFNPWNHFISNELSQYPKIVCIINNNVNINLNNNININNNSIRNIILNNNQNGSKIKLLNFTSDWKKNLYFDTNSNSNEFIKSGSINPNNIQEYIFWFIDINNQFNDNDNCFNTIIRLIWKSMQQQINLMNLGINIGQFNKNNNEIICNKYKELIMNYHNDLDINKKPIYKSQMRKQLQKVFDYYFNNQNKLNNSKINIYDNNKSNTQEINFNDNSNFNQNNLNAYQNVNLSQNDKSNNFANPFAQRQNQMFNNNNNFKAQTQIFNANNNNINKMNNNINTQSIPQKLNILCITWNVAGISSQYKYDIRDLITQNIFYKNKKNPDIIIIGLQEIVELDIYTILSITTNEDSVSDWTKIITSAINSIYPFTFKQISIQNLVGIYYICFAQSYIKDKIEIIDTKVVKTGLFGTLGNKGYLTLNLKLFKNTEISFAIGHLESGLNSNEQRISTLKQILSTKIGEEDYGDSPNSGKKFKNSEFWFILGDLNFRIDASFEKCFELIQRREFDKLIEYDQLYKCILKDGGLIDINETKINFPPTYKYISGSNNYVNDIENLRTPSWTDRILFCHKNNIRNLEYCSIPSVMYSDHRPVQASFEIDINRQNKIENNYQMYNNFGGLRNNNTYIGNNNFNNNNRQNNFGNNNKNFNGFTNNFGNNNNNPWNNNEYKITNNNNQNLYSQNIINNQRNNFNSNFSINQSNNNPKNNYQMNNQNDSNQLNQQSNSNENKNDSPKNYDKINKNKTVAITNKIDLNNNNNNINNNDKNNSENNKNNSENDNDTIENMMKFFK